MESPVQSHVLQVIPCQVILPPEDISQLLYDLLQIFLVLPVDDVGKLYDLEVEFDPRDGLFNVKEVVLDGAVDCGVATKSQLFEVLIVDELSQESLHCTGGVVQEQVSPDLRH